MSNLAEFFDILDPNGVYTGKTASRDDCHREGFWPGLWDVTAGGHVLANELNYQAAIRETAEELGITLTKNDLEFIGAVTSENIIGNITNRHFNEYYITHLDLDPQTLKLQPEEVEDIRWISIKELRKRINNNHDGIADKTGCWEYLFWYLDRTSRV